MAPECAHIGHCCRSAQNSKRPRAAKKALGSLAGITVAVEQSIGRIAHRPEKVEMEFSVSLTAKCDQWITSGAGEAEFKVALAWGEGE
jgi:uncharacterized protein YfiM (DUF2279 family)